MKKYIVTIDNDEIHDEFIEWALNHEYISIQKYINENEETSLESIRDQISNYLINEGFEYEGSCLEKWYQPRDGLYWSIVTVDFLNTDRCSVDYGKKEDWGYINVYKDMDCGGYGGSRTIKLDRYWYGSLQNFCAKYNEIIKPLVDKHGRLSDINDDSDSY
jgi:hypothetical protein